MSLPRSEEANPSAGAPTAHQRYIAARHGDEVVGFIQSYVDENDLPALDSVIASIKLDWK